MKGKIKILSLLLAVAMVSSMFVACGEKTEVTPESTAPASTAQNEEVKRDPVKLTWYCWGDPQKKPDAVIKALNEQSMKDIQTEIDFKFNAGDEKVKTMTATGGEFDIVFTCAWYNNYIVAAQGNQLADLTEKVKTITPDLFKYIPEIVWDGSKVNGKIFAVPVYKDTAATEYWLANKEYVFDGAKAEAEFKSTGKKYATATPLLKKIKEYADKGNKYPNDLKGIINATSSGVGGSDNGWDDLGLGLYMGLNIDKGETKLVPMWEDAEYKEELKTLRSWFDAGYLNKDIATCDKEHTDRLISFRQCYEGSEADMTADKDYHLALNKKYGPVYTTGSIQGSMNGISPNSKNIDRALEYIQYSNVNKVYRNMLAYGIEGTNWKLNDKGQCEKINDDWAPGTFSQASFFELYPISPADPDMWNKLKAANDSATPSPIVGFVADTSKVKTEIAAIQSLVGKYAKPLRTGTGKDVDALCAKAMKAVRAAGFDKVMAEMQAQIDAFIAAK